MRRAVKYEICGIEGDQRQLCVDWYFSDHVQLDQANFRQDGCNCVITNTQYHGDDTVTCNQWLNWEGGLKRCEVHEWVYLEYANHVERSIELMHGRSLKRTPVFPVAVTRMK
jgi:hypothetical protein